MTVTINPVAEAKTLAAKLGFELTVSEVMTMRIQLLCGMVNPYDLLRSAIGWRMGC